jgi:hypothetical protein
VQRKELGNPLIYKGFLRALDRKKLTGTLFNLVTKKESKVRFFNEEALDATMDYFSKKDILIEFIGSPLVEYGAADPLAGDIYFIGIL